MLPVRRMSGRSRHLLRRNDIHSVHADPEGPRALPRAWGYALDVAIDANLGKVDEVMTALYDIQDPEIGMSIVDLDLIKAVEIGADGVPTEIKMVLTTPFCPWAGELIQTVKTKTEEVVGPPVKVTLLAERWEPPPGLF
jgi:metal-sulfur cluster biosynthetic enzyme